MMILGPPRFAAESCHDAGGLCGDPAPGWLGGGWVGGWVAGAAGACSEIAGGRGCWRVLSRSWTRKTGLSRQVGSTARYPPSTMSLPPLTAEHASAYLSGMTCREIPRPTNRDYLQQSWGPGTNQLRLVILGPSVAPRHSRNNQLRLVILGPSESHRTLRFLRNVHFTFYLTRDFVLKSEWCWWHSATLLSNAAQRCSVA